MRRNSRHGIKIEHFEKFRKEVNRRCNGIDGIEKIYRGAGASVGKETEETAKDGVEEL